MGIAIAPSQPNRIYALIENKEKNALYRSDDGGGWNQAQEIPCAEPFFSMREEEGKEERGGGAGGEWEYAEIDTGQA